MLHELAEQRQVALIAAPHDDAAVGPPVRPRAQAPAEAAADDLEALGEVDADRAHGGDARCRAAEATLEQLGAGLLGALGRLHEEHLELPAADPGQGGDERASHGLRIRVTRRDQRPVGDVANEPDQRQPADQDLPAAHDPPVALGKHLHRREPDQAPQPSPGRELGDVRTRRPFDELVPATQLGGIGSGQNPDVDRSAGILHLGHR